jgi:hypothetical protein
VNDIELPGFWVKFELSTHRAHAIRDDVSFEPGKGHQPDQDGEWRTRPAKREAAKVTNAVPLLHEWRLDSAGNETSSLPFLVGAGENAQFIELATLPDGTLLTAQNIVERPAHPNKVRGETTIGHWAAGGNLVERETFKEKNEVTILHLKVSSAGQKVLSLRRTGAPLNPYQDAFLIRRF